MVDEIKGYELTTSLSVVGATSSNIGQYSAYFEDALSEVLPDYPAITAYYVLPDFEALEVKVGLRFEGMPAKNIEETADEVVQATIVRATEAAGNGHSAVREESTLVPA